MASEKDGSRVQSLAELLAQVERHTWLYSVDLGEVYKPKDSLSGQMAAWKSRMREIFTSF